MSITPHDRQAIRDWECEQERETNGIDIPEDVYRECARKFLRVMAVAMGDLDRTAAWWKVQFALGTIHCEGRTMTDVARELGIERAAISKGATDLCRRIGVPPSFYMKGEQSQESYRRSRKSQLTNQ